MRIILCGLIGRYPWGGVAWCSLMYLLGLRRLGHEVWYLEDTLGCNFDPEANALATDLGYALRRIHETLALQGAIEASVDDPKKRWHVDFFRRDDRLFTFGANIGAPASDIPTAGFTWIPTWQPVDLDARKPSSLPPRRTWTMVMTWRIESFKGIGGNKDSEFAAVLGLASELRSHGVEMELAVAGPRQLLADAGWRTVDAFAASSDFWRYHAFLSSSRAEFSVAKHTHVRTRSGWFSDRTACYLAAGRPAVVQDTGFSAHLPKGEGLLAWSTPEEARDAILREEADLSLHERRAREVAEECLRAETVLGRLLGEL